MGRKPKDPERVHTSWRVKPETRQWIRIEAARLGITQGEVIDRLVEEKRERDDQETV